MSLPRYRASVACLLLQRACFLQKSLLEVTINLISQCALFFLFLFFVFVSIVSLSACWLVSEFFSVLDSGISYNTDELGLREAFSRYGQVVDGT